MSMNHTRSEMSTYTGTDLNRDPLPCTACHRPTNRQDDAGRPWCLRCQAGIPIDDERVVPQ